MSEFELGTHSANVGLSDIAVGPDGNLWFTEGGRTKVGRITTSGQITEFELPAGAGGATAIAAGADGNLWYTESGVSRIGRIMPSGDVTEFPLGGAREFWGGGIVAGPDGALWVTLPGAGAIARIGTDGSEADFPLPEEAPAGYPNDIVAGPDGALWFGKSRGAILGRITTGGEVTEILERTFFQAAWHVSRLLSLVLASTTATNNKLVALFVGTAGAAFALTVRVDGVTSTGRLTLATTVGVVDRVHGDTTDGRANALPPHTASCRLS